MPEPEVRNPTDLPLYIALPPQGQPEHYTTLSRSSLDRLTRPQTANGFKPPVRSRVVHPRGKKGKGRGRRLIELKSLLDYLAKDQGAEHALL